MAAKSKWDERYSEPGFAYGTAPNEFLVSAAGRIPARGKVLSLAEGEGRNAVYLARLGYAVTAVDASQVGLEKAEKLAADNGVKITPIVADLKEFALGEGVWDGIVSIWFHAPGAVRKWLYEQCVRALKPGGVLIVEAYRPEQLELGTGGPPDRDFLVTLADLKAALMGLNFEVASETFREVHEGRLHNGRSAVVQVVAKKPTAAG